jgi:phospholipid transport system substrate-binding protein
MIRWHCSNRGVDRRSLLIGVALAALTPILMRPLAALAGPSEAEQFVRQLIDDALAVLQLPVDAKVDRRAGFARILEGHFDLNTIARLVVGRFWPKASDEQKKNFVRAFREHIVNVYSSQLGAYQDETVEIKQVIPRDGADTVVFTEVIRQGDKPPLRLDWLVRGSDSGFKIIDVAAEGVSMMTTKRSEFASVIAREGLDGLIKRLDELNAQVRTDSASS